MPSASEIKKENAEEDKADNNLSLKKNSSRPPLSEKS